MTGTKTSTRTSPHVSHGHSQRVNMMPPTPLGNPMVVPSSVVQAVSPGPSLRSTSAHKGSRAPSPNYFGLVVDSASDARDSAARTKANWSSPTSSIRSFGGTSPQHVSAEDNPDFELFRGQTEGGGSGFSLGHGNLSRFASSPLVRTTKVAKHDTQDVSPKTIQRPRDLTPMDVEEKAHTNSAVGTLVRQQLSSNPPSFFDIPRHESPMHMSPVQRNVISRLEDRHPRLSLPGNKADPPSPHELREHRGSHQRADTLPSTLDESVTFIPAAQLKNLIGQVSSSDYLLLDLRVFPQYSQSRIKDSLNLCIPTTLLKRPSFDLQKLQDTFTGEAEKKKFSQWRSANFIVVYDAYSSTRKDAVLAINTLKKFTTEGWKGHSYILKGGFAAVSKEYPKLIDTQSTQENRTTRIGLSLGTKVPEVAPVAGGCMMPASKNPTIPFFSNIRQNQDLIGGVGQMDVQLPDNLDKSAQKQLPRWLKKVSAQEDCGKDVSNKFLHLELDEKSRMTKALSSGVQYGTPALGEHDVQIAGIEKGGKNRYNNIWPFEHTRVKIQGRAEGACDYINANHIKASRSNKRYIASQGPLPATFEDFWSVIWDQDVRVIVMLTAESEGGQLKCHPYWASKDFGPLKLKALSEKKVSIEPNLRRSSSSESRDPLGRRRANTTSISDASRSPTTSTSEIPHVIVRKFALSHASHPFSPIREITQIHYASWPDFGAPAKPSQLLGLVELGDYMQRGSSSAITPPRADEPEGVEGVRPILVHCSAGCGRTGTFCTVDSVIDMLKRQRKEVSRLAQSKATDVSNSPTTMQIKNLDSSSFVSSSTPLQDIDYLTTSTLSNKTLCDDDVHGDWLFDIDLDLVEKTVEDFRGQRISMVQSLRQFVLCYETVLEWIAQQDRVGSGIGAAKGVGAFAPVPAMKSAIGDATVGGIGRERGRERSGSAGGIAIGADPGMDTVSGLQGEGGQMLT